MYEGLLRTLQLGLDQVSVRRTAAESFPKVFAIYETLADSIVFQYWVASGSV